jgi:hypothetical protein
MTTTTTAVVGQSVRPDRLSLNDAQSYLTTTEEALSGWYAGQTSDTHNYVSDGHEAIHVIDELLRELCAVR